MGNDHHVEHLRCFYSVPSQLAGERVDLRVTASLVEVFRSGRRVALHALLAEPGNSATLPEHRPVAHQRVLEGEPKALMQWATAVGVSAQEMIGYHLNERRDPANGMRAARRMRDLARDHGEDRFESVCRYALPLNITSLRSITSILTNQADLRPRAATPPPRMEHDNLRGAQYFGD